MRANGYKNALKALAEEKEAEAKKKAEAAKIEASKNVTITAHSSAPAKKSFVQILDSEINSQVDSLWMWLLKISHWRQWAFKIENFEFNSIFFFLDIYYLRVNKSFA